MEATWQNKGENTSNAHGLRMEKCARLAPLHRARRYESVDKWYAQFRVQTVPLFVSSTPRVLSLPLLKHNKPANLDGDFSQLQPPFQARPIPKSSYFRPLPNPAHFLAKKSKDLQLERLEVSAILEVSEAVSSDFGY
ncbi:unnamed protein product [Prunus armeniaca]